jgi:hypothetical protein
MSTERRPLKFERLFDVVADAESLHARGHDKAGQWDLAQVCNHLAEWMRYPIDGFPPAPFPVRVILWTMRKTAGKRMLRSILENGFKPGGPTVPASVSASGGDESAAVAKLRDAVARFENHSGPLHPSPLFGDLDKATATKLQLVHCAHHLSFLVPK